MKLAFKSVVRAIKSHTMCCSDAAVEAKCYTDLRRSSGCSYESHSLPLVDCISVFMIFCSSRESRLLAFAPVMAVVDVCLFASYVSSAGLGMAFDF